MSEKSRYEYRLKSEDLPRCPISFEFGTFIETFQDQTCIMSTERKEKLAVFRNDELAFLVKLPCTVVAEEDEFQFDLDDTIVREFPKFRAFWTLKEWSIFSGIFVAAVLITCIIIFFTK